MKRAISFIICLPALVLFFQPLSLLAAERSFFDLSATDIEGREVSFDRYRGKVVLVSNISLKCGTTPQLKDLEALYERYSDRGLVVLGFPNNAFTGDREPKDREEIKETCSKKYGVTFPLFSLVPVRGESAHDVFKFLTSKCKEDLSGPISFNLEKFLVDRRGDVRQRFGAFTGALSDAMIAEIELLLGERAS